MSETVTVKHWLVTPLVRLLRPLIWPEPLVLAAVPGQAPTVGVAEVVMLYRDGTGGRRGCAGANLCPRLRCCRSVPPP
ncbi:MAG: hypothetical protein IPN04_02880 [Rhodoferax sp.]|nr:hypothetical protein [Rhodoferax sp.]